MADTGDKVQRKYSNFRGVDFRGDECGLNRSPDSLNVWRNYKKLASIETRPGLDSVHIDQKGVRHMMWHAGKLYYITGDGYLKSWKNGVQESVCYVGKGGTLFTFDGILYAMGPERYQNVTEGKEVAPYIPTTSIGRKPAGGGTIHEDVNLLSPLRKNSFLADGVSTKFYCDAKDWDEYNNADELPASYYCRVWVNGTEKTVVNPEESDPPITYNPEGGYVEFATAPVAPNTDGQDNVVIQFRKTVDEHRERILNCTIVQEFDNRLFVAGNPKYPSIVRHCSLNAPNYFSDLDYYRDGNDGVPIRSMVAGNNGLWVFREESPYNNSVFYHTPALDNDYGKVYPSSHSSIAIGCVGRAVNFNDDILFFSRRGAERASTDITTEQFVTHKSSLVDRKLTANPKYKDMILAEWEGYLLVLIGSVVYLSDSRAQVTNKNHYEYEWFHWNLGELVVTCATVHDGVLYIGTEDGNIYSFTRDPADGDEHSGYYPDGQKWQEQMYINSYWTTPVDRFGAPNKLKTTNKKGCVVEGTGDMDVYVKVEDTDFEFIGSYKDISDYFASRIKRKKWKDIQLKFQSNTKFSLETATLEAFVGSYIKR